MKIPSPEELKNIINSHQTISDTSCVFMSIELVLKLLGIKPHDYFELQKGNETIKGFGGDYDGKLFGGDGVLSYYTPPNMRTVDCDLDDLFNKINDYLDKYLLVVIPLKSDGNHHDINGEYHVHVLYKYDDKLDEYYGVTYYNNKSEPSFEEDIKNKIILEHGTSLQYFETNHIHNKEDKNKIESVLESKRKE